MRADPQRELFPPSKEDQRKATIDRLWGDHPKIKTAAKFFDYAEATRIARSASPPLDACIEVSKPYDALGGG